MTKSQLIDRIAERAPHVPRRDVERIVNTVFEAMVDALRRTERIEIRGFGSFAVKIRQAREGRNPRTGERVRVPRRLTPYFTPGKELRDRLNAMASTGAVENESEIESAAGGASEGESRDPSPLEPQQLLMG
ncbi:MAG TPA: integration host factor subunit beta [Myxococcaceae bacterium]|nr:integration host factor subunit beta [Myxococcaceae bacterium]